MTIINKRLSRGKLVVIYLGSKTI